MERRDLFQDDLTEERYPSPARREEAASSQPLDPDVLPDDDEDDEDEEQLDDELND